MTIRSGVGRLLRTTVGGSRTERLRRRELAARQRAAHWLAPPSGAGEPATGTPVTAAVVEKPVVEKPAMVEPPEETSPPAEPALSRQQLIAALGEVGTEGLGAGSPPPAGLTWASPDPAEHTSSGMHKHNMMARLHQLLQPRTYFEVGVDQGQSLTLSRCRSVAVDPKHRITRAIRCDVRTFLQTSDEFFATPGNFDHFDGLPIDLAFIDGMHLAEYVIRDFASTEKQMSPGGAIVLDDMFPRNALEAQRVRRTSGWAGDVYKVHDVLRQQRPDLTLLPINTEPTGTYLVVGLDPTSTVLDEMYEDNLATLSVADPQTVDADWTRRTPRLRPDHDPDDPGLGGAACVAGPGRAGTRVRRPVAGTSRPAPWDGPLIERDRLVAVPVSCRGSPALLEVWAAGRCHELR